MQYGYNEGPWDNVDEEENENEEEDRDPIREYWESDQALMDWYGVDTMEELQDAQDDDIGWLND